MTKQLAWLCALLLSALGSSSAMAEASLEDTLVLLDAEGDAGPLLQAAGRDAVASALVLRGASVVHVADAAEQLEGLGRSECEDRTCWVQALSLLGAQRIAAPAVWPPKPFRKEGSVAVTLEDARGSVTGKAPLAAANRDAIVNAMAVALEAALAQWHARGEVVVHFDAVPRGASLVVDGQPLGTVPIDVPLLPGRHPISLSMDGYTTQTRDLDVAPGADQHVVLALDPSKPVTDSAARPSQPASRANPWHIAGASTLGAVGVAAIIAGAVMLAADASCERRELGTCVASSEPKVGPGIALLSIGVVAAAGSGAWFWLLPRASTGRSGERALTAGVAARW